MMLYSACTFYCDYFHKKSLLLYKTWRQYYTEEPQNSDHIGEWGQAFWSLFGGWFLLGGSSIVRIVHFMLKLSIVTI